MGETRSGKRGFVSRILFRRITWIGAALLLLGVFGAFHALGWRDDTAIISGTVNSTSFHGAAIRGVLYALFYFAAVVVSPILLIAGMIDLLFRKMSSEQFRLAPKYFRCNSARSSRQSEP